ncbi:unnamed protein product [Phaedon cochleariae]|uniref:Uncharacterized protein n=1 Tax=Phaedon cochleariae TaxID=80249 RepID=A0A9N9SJQ4_PHACE|nr:unnamed protein product [Phaedon cochleariae]
MDNPPENEQSDEDMSDNKMIANEQMPTTSSGSGNIEIILNDNSSDDVNFDELVAEQQKEHTFSDYVERKSTDVSIVKFKNIVREMESFVYRWSHIEN